MLGDGVLAVQQWQPTPGDPRLGCYKMAWFPLGFANTFFRVRFAVAILTLICEQLDGMDLPPAALLRPLGVTEIGLEG